MTATTALTQARTNLLLTAPFFGVLALRLKFVEDNNQPTLATDGSKIIYNSGFVTSLPKSRLRAAIAHEVLHCALEHVSADRVGARNRRRWNFAIDYATNLLLSDAGLDVDKKEWLYDEAYRGMAAETIYAKLPNGSGDDSKLLDSHILGAPTEVEQAAWKTAVVQAAQAAKMAGKLPGGLERFVEELIAPRVDWKEKLARFMHAQGGKNDYSWMKPQRRMLVHGHYLPSAESPRMGTVVAVSDDSGSVDDKTLQALASEINGLRISVQPESLIHISCDADINHMATFNEHEEFKMVSKGGGGTDFRPPFDYLSSNSIEPACLIYLTDGYGPFPDAPPDYPVLWCMTTDVVPPWGEHVRIEV